VRPATKRGRSPTGAPTTVDHSRPSGSRRSCMPGQRRARASLRTLSARGSRMRALLAGASRLGRRGFGRDVAAVSEASSRGGRRRRAPTDGRGVAVFASRRSAASEPRSPCGRALDRDRSARGSTQVCRTGCRAASAVRRQTVASESCGHAVWQSYRSRADRPDHRRISALSLRRTPKETRRSQRSCAL
jgi:hypothetical protein